MDTFNTIEKRNRNVNMAVENLRDSILGEKRLTLRQINEKAGAKGLAESMIIAYVKDFADYCNFNEPVTTEQFQSIAQLIMQKWGNIKATELMVFMSHLKSGQYGAFYGKFDPLRFMAYLRQFVKWRNDKSAEYFQSDEQERRKKEMQGAISIEEYFRLYPERKQGSNLTKIMSLSKNGIQTEGIPKRSI